MRDRKAQPLVATAEVTNTGNREGTEIVQCYINVRGASTEQPVRTLKGFARITLKPGESRTVSFPLGFEELSFYNVKAQATVEPGTEYTVYIGGNSTAEQAAHFRLTQ
jgi:beta-glucosidase